ncbi:MAG: hypothetical protein AAF125_00620 [Chloroflexota bacterium]
MQVQWQNTTKTVVQQTFEAGWTEEEYKQTLLKSLEMVRNQDHNVHLVADMTAPTLTMTKFPLVFTKVQVDLPENLGYVVVANGNRFMAMTRMVKTLYPRLESQLRFVETKDEAYQFLADL